jgi:hypothetical protein
MKRTRIVLYTGAPPNDVTLQELPLPVADAAAAQVTNVWVRPPSQDNPRSGFGAWSVPIVLREGTTPPGDLVLELSVPARVVVALQNADVQMWRWDRFLGAAATSQAAQTMTASGTVTAAVVPAPAPATHGAGRGRARRARWLDEALPVHVLWTVPTAVTGTVAARQGRQVVRASGHVRQMVKGRAAARQATQIAAADGAMDTRRRDERDLIEILMLLDAA